MHFAKLLQPLGNLLQSLGRRIKVLSVLILGAMSIKLLSKGLAAFFQ